MKTETTNFIVRAQSLAEEGKLPRDPKDDLLTLALKTIE